MEISELRKHDILNIAPKLEAIGSDEWVYGYEIIYLPKEFENAKRRVPHFQHIESFKEGFGTYSGGWDTPEEAIGEAIKYCIENIINK